MERLELVGKTMRRQWETEGIPVLTAEIELPAPSDEQGGPGRIARYYRHFARSYLRYCDRFLFPQASQACQEALRTSAPLPRCTASLTHRVTLNEGGLLSLFTDAVECCGTRPLRVRRGDTWDLERFLPTPLSDFFPPRSPIRKHVTEFAASYIERQLKEQTAVYREDWRRALRRGFNRENFYLTPEGLCVFYQMFVIAPPVEGIPVFCIPYGEDGPFPKPRRE